MQEQERVFFQDSNVLVTQSRFVSGDKTYAMRNISSVYCFEIKRSKKPAIYLIILGFILLFPSKTTLYIGLLLILIGIIWYFQIKNLYSVKIQSNSGEADGFISSDKEYIQKIVNAINESIVYRG